MAFSQITLQESTGSSANRRSHDFDCFLNACPPMAYALHRRMGLRHVQLAALSQGYISCANTRKGRAHDFFAGTSIRRHQLIH